jgi:hypothetical protein
MGIKGITGLSSLRVQRIVQAVDIPIRYKRSALRPGKREVFGGGERKRDFAVPPTPWSSLDAPVISLVFLSSPVTSGNLPLLSSIAPRRRNNKVHFLETLHALCGRVAGVHLPEDEEFVVHDKMISRLPRDEIKPKYNLGGEFERRRG